MYSGRNSPASLGGWSAADMGCSAGLRRHATHCVTGGFAARCRLRGVQLFGVGTLLALYGSPVCGLLVYCYDSDDAQGAAGAAKAALRFPTSPHVRVVSCVA